MPCTPRDTEFTKEAVEREMPFKAETYKNLEAIV